MVNDYIIVLIVMGIQRQEVFLYVKMGIYCKNDNIVCFCIGIILFLGYRCFNWGEFFIVGMIGSLIFYKYNLWYECGVILLEFCELKQNI